MFHILDLETSGGRGRNRFVRILLISFHIKSLVRINKKDMFLNPHKLGFVMDNEICKCKGWRSEATKRKTGMDTAINFIQLSAIVSVKGRVAGNEMKTGKNWIFFQAWNEYHITDRCGVLK